MVLCSYQDTNGTLNSKETGNEKNDERLDNGTNFNNNIIEKNFSLIKDLLDKLIEQNLDSSLQVINV